MVFYLIVLHQETNTWTTTKTIMYVASCLLIFFILYDKIGRKPILPWKAFLFVNTSDTWYMGDWKTIYYIDMCAIRKVIPCFERQSSISFNTGLWREYIHIYSVNMYCILNWHFQMYELSKVTLTQFLNTKNVIFVPQMSFYWESKH